MKKALLVLIPTIYGIVIHYYWDRYTAIVVAGGVSLTILMLLIFFDAIEDL